MKKDETKQIIPEGYYTIDEMCQLLNLKRSTFNTARSIRKHALPPQTKTGKLILYDKESFRKWLKGKEEKRNE